MKKIVIDNVVGIAATDISLKDLVDRINNLVPSPNGGSWLASSEFKVITYCVDSSFLPHIIDDENGSSDIDYNETLPNKEKTSKYIIQGNVAFLNAYWVFKQVEILEHIDKYDYKGIHIDYIKDYDGTKKYEATMVVASTGWILGVNIPLSDYTAEIQHLVNNQTPIIVLAVLMSAISIVIAYVYINNMRKRQKLEKNIVIAQTANKTKSDFLSKMSHEMRTPMNAIIGMTKIAETTNDVTKLKYCLSTIEASSSHLLSIINDVLDMSKIEAGKLELVEAPMNMEKMLMKICNLIIDKSEQKGQRLDIVLGKNMKMHYICDELRLSQVITNLLSNAVKFTPEAGKIKLSVDEVGEENNMAVLSFSVSDTGIGMTQEQLGRLFQSFEQADSSISRRFGGTGLGLVISKSIVEKMDGKVHVESKLDKGSTFTFEIKVQRSPKQDAAVILDGICPSDLKVLVVDDDIETRQQLKTITEQFGILTDEADSGKKAIYLVEQAKETKKIYDVIFIDYDMSQMNGIETIQNLSANIDKNTIIIMTSFLTWNKIEHEAKNVGVSRFIAKPLFPSSVLDSINEIVWKTVKNLDIKTAYTKEETNFENINLLLVEDIEINREIFIALLEHTKINIDSAENGKAAIDMFKANPNKYDLIFMDIQMPEMDGYTATKAIRSLHLPKAKTIPILAMTANVFKEDIDRCIECGMNAHLAKPINEAEVIEKITAALKSKTN